VYNKSLCSCCCGKEWSPVPLFSAVELKKSLIEHTSCLCCSEVDFLVNELCTFLFMESHFCICIHQFVSDHVVIRHQKWVLLVRNNSFPKNVTNASDVTLNGLRMLTNFHDCTSTKTSAFPSNFTYSFHFSWTFTFDSIQHFCFNWHFDFLPDCL